MHIPIFKHMTLGTAYYPEHWDKSLWEEDILRMQEHGISLVRIGDFAWSKYEYEEGVFTIDYFDSFLGLCKKHHMDVLFCTPTAAPPIWLSHRYPEILNCDIEGNKYYGPRRHYNYNSPVYRQHCEQIVEKLAEHYSKLNIIIGWQIDNEISNDVNEFYSEADHTAYREYLKNKFTTLDSLNDAMGLAFWNRTYSSWDQVSLNRKCVSGAVNPHLALEEKRFFSESAISFCALQIKTLKKYLPKDKFITTNGLFTNLDNHKLVKCGLDFIAFDSYPNFAFDLSENPKQPDNLNDRKWSRLLTWTRSVSPVFGIMEQQSGANGWTSRMETPMPEPGQMRLWTMQSIAHGADMVSFFRWRTSPIGCEIYWHGLNDYSNTDNRRLRELKEIRANIQNLEILRGTNYKAKIAVLKDSSNEWDAALDCWHKRVDAFSENSWFMATQLTHTPCDFLYLQPETSLEKLSTYEMLIYPHAAIMEQHTSGLLKAYVENGGTLVFGARTGYKDIYGRCPMRHMPGLISQWCGVTVTDYTLIGPDSDDINIIWNGKSICAPVFNEVLEAHDAQIAAYFDGNYYSGQPALCKKTLGKGTVYYLGACFSVEMVKAFLENTEKASPYQNIIQLPETVELAVRSDGNRNYFFILNYKGQDVNITLKHSFTELISGKVIDGNCNIAPYGVMVLG
jgi:beta-galactosidase